MFLNECPAQLKILERDIAKLELVKAPFPRLTYTEAIDILKQKGMDIEWGADLGGDEESVLSEAFDKPVFVTHYPC